MNKTNKNKIALIVISAALSLFSFQSAYAEAVDSNAAIFQEINRLREMKQSDPAAYRQLINSKKKNLQGRVQNLKEKHPEKFQKFLKQENSSKRERLQRLRKNNPEAFQQFVGQRAQRLKTMAAKNPQRFDRLMKKNPRVQQKFQDWKQNGFPDTQNLKNSPQHQRRFEGQRKDSLQNRKNPEGGDVRARFPEGGPRAGNQSGVRDDRVRVAEGQDGIQTRREAQVGRPRRQPGSRDQNAQDINRRGGRNPQGSGRQGVQQSKREGAGNFNRSAQQGGRNNRLEGGGRRQTDGTGGSKKKQRVAQVSNRGGIR